MRSIPFILILISLIPLSLLRISESLGQWSIVQMGLLFAIAEFSIVFVLIKRSFSKMSGLVYWICALWVLFVFDYFLSQVPIGPLFGYGPHYVKVVPNPNVS